MTEDEWLAATDSWSLLDSMKRTWPGLRTEAGRRRFRLFACACARRVWSAFPSKSMKRAIEAAERFADGTISSEQFWEAGAEARDQIRQQPHDLLWNIVSRVTNPNSGHAALVWKSTTNPQLDARRGNGHDEENRELATLIRCIFCSPFRPVSIDSSWKSSTAFGLAEAIYADRAFDRLPLLADALEDADCDNADVLAHCRGPGPHARGCWVVDLVLGKV